MRRPLQEDLRACVCSLAEFFSRMKNVSDKVVQGEHKVVP